MKILITGATGFIGKNLIEKLTIKKEYNIRALVRKESKKEDIDFLKKHKVELFYGNILKINKLKNITKDIDIVFHLAGSLGGYLKDKKLYDLNISGTKNILSLCSYQKFIYCSSAGILGPIIDGNEKLNPKPSNIYERSKLEAEKLVKQYQNHIIIRPEFLYGKYDKHVLKLFKAIKERRFFIIGKGNSLLHPTYIDDLIMILIECIKKPLKNETFIIAGDRRIIVKDYYALIAKNLNVKINKFHLPYFLANIYILTIGFLLEKIGIDPILTKSRFNFFTKSRTFKTDKIKKYFDYKPIKFEEGIKKTLDWNKKEGFI